MGEVITNSYNLFVDTSRNHNSGSKGDDFVVNLQDAGVHAGDGEHIRLTLDNFSMAKTFSNVNPNNSRLRLRGTSDGTTFWDDGSNLDFLDFDVDDANYMSRNDLAQNFAKKLIAALNTLSGSVSSGGPGTFSLDESSNKLKPESAAGETDNIIQFTLAYTGQQLSTTAAEIYIQMFSEESDSFALLGGDRIEGKVPETNSTQSTKKSINIEIKNNKTVDVQCRYPSQLSTEPYVYIRAPGTLNTNIETKGLKTTDTLHKSDTEHSDILGRAVIANNNWVQYESKTGREFFLDIHQKQLNTLRLRVTDARNRLIARKSLTNTASGSGKEQSTLGNLNFSAVIRFDIIKSKKIEHLESEHYKSTVPARFSNGVVNQLRGGKDTFGVGPGF
jgi:hypothetical protein